MTRFPLRALLLTATVAVATLGLAAPAHAQDDAEEDRKVVYKSKTEIDFEGLNVDGELQKPQSALVLDRKKASFNPLIKLRLDFNEEMEQSIDEVK
jgi:hypothetical protein